VERYLEIKERFAALLPEDKAGPKRILGELGPELREIAESARDPHLRANASLLLGTLHEDERRPPLGDLLLSSGRRLLPEEAGPHRVLAMALAPTSSTPRRCPSRSGGRRRPRRPRGLAAARRARRSRPGRRSAATEAYAAYEMRRKGLIDGITLKSPDGVFIAAGRSSGPPAPAR
jgi:hypothetical protein